jgi:hypothetical protein
VSPGAPIVRLRGQCAPARYCVILPHPFVGDAPAIPIGDMTVNSAVHVPSPTTPSIGIPRLA